MKKVILALSLCLSSLALADQKIELSEGSSVKMTVGQETTVTCGARQSADTDSRKCFLKKSSIYDYIHVFAGTSDVGSYSDLESATKAIKNLKASGACD